jgi:hypothetical protein
MFPTIHNKGIQVRAHGVVLSRFLGFDLRHIVEGRSRFGFFSDPAMGILGYSWILPTLKDRTKL